MKINGTRDNELMKLITLSKEVEGHINGLIYDKKTKKLEQLADHYFQYDNFCNYYPILKYALEVLATKDGVCAIWNRCLFIGKSEEEINQKIFSIPRKKTPKTTVIKMIISRLEKVDYRIDPFKIMRVDDLKEARSILYRKAYSPSKDDISVYGLVDLVQDHNLTDEDIVNARNLMVVQGVLEE